MGKVKSKWVVGECGEVVKWWMGEAALPKMGAEKSSTGKLRGGRRNKKKKMKNDAGK